MQRTRASTQAQAHAGLLAAGAGFPVALFAGQGNWGKGRDLPMKRVDCTATAAAAAGCHPTSSSSVYVGIYLTTGLGIRVRDRVRMIQAFLGA